MHQSPAETPLEVLHVNDVSSVSSNLVDGLCGLGVHAALYQPTIGTYRASRLTRWALPLIRTKESFDLRRRVRADRVKILHIHYARFAYMAFVGRLSYWLHCHGGDLRTDLDKPLIRELTLAAVRRAVRVYCSTPDLLAPLRELRPDAVFLPNPIDCEAFQAGPRTDPEGPPKILSISKLDARKGISTILDGVRLILQRCPDAQVGIVGFGDSTASAGASLAEAARDPRVTVHGRIPHERMPEFIRSHDVVVGQQDAGVGAMGMSELEAMACGRPVVCRFEYGHAYPEAPPVRVSRSAEEIAQQVQVLIEAPEKARKLGSASRRWVVTYHEKRFVAQTLLDQYREALAEDGALPSLGEG